MTTNGHGPRRASEATAIVEINTLSEDDQVVNPADHYGKPSMECRCNMFLLFRLVLAGVTSDYSIQVNSANTTYTDDFIESKYTYEMNHCDVDHQNKKVNIIPRKHLYNFRTKRHVQRTGVMLVGWGGNNGTTLTGAVIANRDQIKWMRKGNDRACFLFQESMCTFFFHEPMCR